MLVALHLPMPFPMIRSLFAVATLSCVALACGSGSSNGTGGDGGGGGDAGQDGDPNPCAGLGCASMAGPLDLHVVDSSNALVAHPTFAEGGRALSATCVTDAGFDIADAGASCDTWRVRDLAQGAHMITVSAVGYAPQTLSVRVDGPPGCCGTGATVEKAVTLTRAGDAGAGDAGDGG